MKATADFERAVLPGWFSWLFKARALILTLNPIPSPTPNPSPHPNPARLVFLAL